LSIANCRLPIDQLQRSKVDSKNRQSAIGNRQ
jgi:hypothetical protein